MLKVMFVLTVLSSHADTAPVVVSQHSTFAGCQKAFRDLNAQLGQNTTAQGYKSTALRTHSYTETEVLVAGRRQPNGEADPALCDPWRPYLSPGSPEWLVLG